MTTKCPQCGITAPPDAKFCDECGTPLPAICPQCGHTVSRKSKFCSECGTPLSAASAQIGIGSAPADTERRHLTVVFCDVVGSTSLSAQLDAEDFRELIQSYQTLCGRIVAELEGHIAQFLGDGILAYFGYPVAHEDDARRALEASLRIVSELEKLDAGRDPLRIRIGIHTGEAVVGSLGGRGHREQLALGETPNVAARVQSAAGENDILLTEATWRLVRSHFQFEPLGPRDLKGLSRDFTLYRLIGRLPQTGQLEAEHAVRTPFTGRHRELEMLKAHWADASRGTGHVIHITGEPGLGKSRLVAMLSAQAQQDGASVVVCRCSPYHRTSALYPFVDLLARELAFQRRESNEQKRQKLRRALTDAGVRHEEAAPLLDALLTISEPGAPSPELTAKRKREIISESISALIAAQPSSAPRLFIMEDLHWADPSSIDLLQVLLNRAAGSAMLIALTYRPEYTRSWDPRANETVLTLKPLAADEAISMIHRVAQGRQIPSSVVEKIFARTEGVPLFVEEVTKAVLESSLLPQLKDSSEEDAGLPPGLIPASVRDSLTARLDRLGEARETLRLASVLGREFSFKVLCAVAETPEHVLAKALQKAEDTGLIYRSSPDGNEHYIFKHALIQDAAYASLVRKTRRRYHDRIARKLTEQFPELAVEQPELIATHFDSAACHHEAAQYWMSAGERAAAKGAIQETLSHYDAALKAMRRLPHDFPDLSKLEIAAQMQLMSARMAAYGWASNEVEESCLRVKELAIELNDGPRLFGALYGLWSVYFLRGELSACLEIALRILEMARQIGTPTSLVASAHAVGYTQYFAGEFTEARRHAEEAFAVATPEAVRDTVAFFQLSSMTVIRAFNSASLWMMGQTLQSAREMRINFETAVELNHLPTIAYAMSFGLYIYHFWRDIGLLRETAQEILRVSAREGYAMWVPMSHMYLAWCDAMEAAPGSPQAEKAAAEAVRARKALHGSRTELMLIQDMVVTAEALRKAGKNSDAIQALDYAIEHPAWQNRGVMLPEAYRVRGEIRAEAGDYSGAEADFQQAIAIARSQSALSLELRAARSLCTLLEARGQEASAGGLVHAVLKRFPSGADISGVLDGRFPAELRYVPAEQAVHHPNLVVTKG